MGQTEPMSRPEGMRSAAAELVFDAATKRYGDGAPAVDHLSLTVPAGEICVLVGPSGGGKTTALKLVNRLIELTSGDIRIDGTSINSLDVTELRRGIGYVIQQVGLFPHLTIEANIGTVPRLFGRSKAVDPHAVGGAARARRPRPVVREALSGAALGRRAAARRPRARARREPAADADGRAVRRDRPDRARAASGRVPAPAAGAAEDGASSSRTTSTRRSRSATASRSSGRAASSSQYDTPAAILASPADDFVARVRRRRPRAQGARAAARSASSSCAPQPTAGRA